MERLECAAGFCFQALYPLHLVWNSLVGAWLRPQVIFMLICPIFLAHLASSFADLLCSLDSCSQQLDAATIQMKAAGMANTIPDSVFTNGHICQVQSCLHTHSREHVKFRACLVFLP